MTIEALCDLLAFLKVIAALKALVTRDANFNREIAAALLFDSVANSQRKTHTIFNAGATPFVSTGVNLAGKKLRKQPAMTSMNNNHAVACHLRQQCGISIAIDGVLDHLIIHGQNINGLNNTNSRVALDSLSNRAPYLMAIVCTTSRKHACVLQFHSSHSAVTTNGICQVMQRAHSAKIIQRNVEGAGLAMHTVNSCVPNTNRRHAANSFALVIGIDHICGIVILLSEIVDGCARAKDSVLEGHVPQRDWLKQMREF